MLKKCLKQCLAHTVRCSIHFRCYYFSLLGDASCYWDYVKGRVITTPAENASLLQERFLGSHWLSNAEFIMNGKGIIVLLH